MACGHRCLIRERRRGICKVRFNQDGVLKVPWGYVAGLQVDPTEKKPIYHLLPGSDTLTFGMLGCDFHCGYCQNWISSQALRDPASEIARGALRPIDPEAGLRFVYAGNLPGRVGPYEHTYCPNCQTRLIRRLGYQILEYRLTEAGACPECGVQIPGVWPESADQVRIQREADRFARMPRVVG